MVFEVLVYLYEGSPVSLGLYWDRADAEKAQEESQDDWDGPNVEYITIHERRVK